MIMDPWGRLEGELARAKHARVQRHRMHERVRPFRVVGTLLSRLRPLLFESSPAAAPATANIQPITSVIHNEPQLPLRTLRPTPLWLRLRDFRPNTQSGQNVQVTGTYDSPLADQLLQRYYTDAMRPQPRVIADLANNLRHVPNHKGAVTFEELATLHTREAIGAAAFLTREGYQLNDAFFGPTADSMRKMTALIELCLDNSIVIRPLPGADL